MIVPARNLGPGAGSGSRPDPSAPSTTPSATGGAPVDGADVTPDTAGAAAPVLVEPPSAEELVAGALAGWRARLVETAGGSTLADVDLLGDAALDLSAAHPSGIAQLFAGRETRLSNLVREGGSLANAKRRARAVGARAEQYAQRYGIAPTYLAIGVATWTERTTPDVAEDDVAALAAVTRRAHGTDPDDALAPLGGVTAPVGATTASEPRTVRAPVLLRPVSLRARGSGESDYELVLEQTLEVNPVVARALRSRGALLDPGAVARGTFTGTGFDPRPALARLASLGGAVLEGFRLTESLVVGTFVHPGQVLVDDLDQLSGTLDRHEVVAALAGVDEARERVLRPLPEMRRGDRDPDVERGVGDLDAAQQHVLDLLATGEHLFVDAPTGSDVTGTLAAVVADAAASGKTVLYVPGHRRAAGALAARLAELGLDDLLLDVAPEAGWRTAAARRLLDAMTLESTPVDAARTTLLRRDLVAHRERLRAYVDALHAGRTPWEASAYDALQALASLTATRPAPRTTVRLAPDVARVLDAESRAVLAADLERAVTLGASTLRPTDTPWFGADLTTDHAARETLDRIGRLLDHALPILASRVKEVAAATGLNEATTVDAWGEQLVMLGGIRGALDVFQPLIFERTAADLVAATATKQWREEHGMPMGFWLRRRLRKQAKDMVRPGRPVADLHTALIGVQEQRQIWQAHCPAGGWPRLPEGLATIEDEYRSVRADLDALDAVLRTTPGGGGLAALALPTLVERLRRLWGDARALDALPERTRLVRSLTAAGLGSLLDDFAARRVEAELAGPELELAWWSTVFEQIIGDDPALADYDGAALGRLAAQYAALDRAHVASLSGPVRRAVVGHVASALRANPGQTQALFAELVEDRITNLRETVTRYPDLVRRLRPVLAASPMLVPQVLPATRTVDLVVLDAAAHLPLEVALAAIARGRQVVVLGDARCASGSAVRELAEMLPGVALRADASRRDPHLTAFLAAHGYGDVLSPTPLPQNAPLVRLDVVDGTGMPDSTSGAVDSTRAEVEHVVELVLTHALTRPDESLAVITPSSVHAEHVREAVLTEVRDNPGLSAFFDAGVAEPFVVADLAGVAGLSRDAVVLSVGFGRTPHGRVLHRFGPIGGPGGDALLLAALGATRHRLDVVSCFRAGDLDPERLRGPGPRLLADLLAFAERRSADSGEVSFTPSTTAPSVSAAAASAAPFVSIPASAAPAVGSTTPVDSTEQVAPAAGASGAAPASRSAADPDTMTLPQQADEGAAREPDRLVVDLAERLWRHGLTVELDHGLPGGTHIPLAVGHPDLPGRLLVAVLTDDEAYVAEPSIRVRDRQVAERLERLGWSVVQVWSAAAFLDPQAEVDRVRSAVEAAIPAAPAAVRPAAGTRAPARVDEPEDDADVETPAHGVAVAPGGTAAPGGQGATEATPAGPDAGRATGGTPTWAAAATPGATGTTSTTPAGATAAVLPGTAGAVAASAGPAGAAAATSAEPAGAGSDARADAVPGSPGSEKRSDGSTTADAAWAEPVTRARRRTPPPAAPQSPLTPPRGTLAARTSPWHAITPPTPPAGPPTTATPSGGGVAGAPRTGPVPVRTGAWPTIPAARRGGSARPDGTPRPGSDDTNGTPHPGGVDEDGGSVRHDGTAADGGSRRSDATRSEVAPARTGRRVQTPATGALPQVERRSTGMIPRVGETPGGSRHVERVSTGSLRRVAPAATSAGTGPGTGRGTGTGTGTGTGSVPQVPTTGDAPAGAAAGASAAHRPDTAPAPDAGRTTLSDRPSTGPTPRVEQPTLAVPSRPRPPIRPGLPINAYSDDQLDEVVTWLVSDGVERGREELAAAVREALGITRRSSRVDAVVAGAVRRATS
ncbi:hypothetical protein [Cellulomonas sp. NS3]|uniref:hypothetical protein n=1 Tax=Cellulomonas sp. NS3 TaxID=2973977 RepID=UPI0028680F03|nr:hypothetical protein [Cellulomonas sp. NS3]